MFFLVMAQLLLKNKRYSWDITLSNNEALKKATQNHEKQEIIKAIRGKEAQCKVFKTIDICQPKL